MSKIALCKNIRVDDWAAERVTIAKMLVPVVKNTSDLKLKSHVTQTRCVSNKV